MSAAFDRQKQRFEADPGDVRAFGALEEQHFADGSWAELVQLYRRRLTAADLKGNPPARARVLFRLAQALEAQSSDSDEALARYEEVARLDPGFRPALRQLRGLYAAREQWELVLQVGELEAGCPMGPEERAALAAELGEIWRGRLNEPGQALPLFERALADYPGSKRAATGIARALAALGRTEESAAAWERQIDRCEGRERAAALAALGHLCAGPLDDAERAFELFRRALGDDRANADALDGLAAIAARREQWALVADLQERRFELTADAARRLAIALEAGGVQLERLQDPRAALLWFERALELAPDDPAVHLALADLERLSGETEALVARLDRAVQLSGDLPPVDVLLEAAALHSARGEDTTALEYLQRAAAIAPQRTDLLDAMVAACDRAGRQDELVDLLESRAALAETDDATRAVALARLGAYYEQALGDFDEARDAYRRAFAAEPSSPGVAVALDRLLRKAEAWDELREVLETARRSAPDGERFDLLCSLGELLADRCDEARAASEVFEEALALDPAAPRALSGLQQIASASGHDETILRAWAREVEVTGDRERLCLVVWEMVGWLEERERLEEAASWLERLVAAEPEDRRAMETLARLSDALGWEEKRIASLERLDRLLPAGQQADNRRRIAGLHARGGRENDAIHWYQAALKADPNDVHALQALLEPLERAGRLRELVKARRRLAALLPPAERASCLSELGQLLAGPLSDPDAAVVVLWRLVEAADAPADADEQLESLLQRTGRFEELAQRLSERRHALDSDSPEAVELDVRRAELLATHLGHFEEAAELYRAIHAAHPDSAALDGLERIARAGHDAAALVDVLTSQAEAAGTPERRAALELERAVLLEERLDRDSEAREAYVALAEGGTGPSAEAEQRLLLLLERRGDWPALRARLEAAVERGSREQQIALHERAARLCQDRLDDPASAAAHLEAATELAPERKELWQRLAALCEDAGRHEALLRALEAELATGPDADRELTLRARAGALCGGPLSDPETARDHYRRVLELAPGHADAVAFLGNRYEAEGRWEQLAELLGSRLEELVARGRPADASRQAELRLQIAGLRSDRLDDVPSAIAVLEPALDELGPTGALAHLLAELYARAGRSDALLTLLGSAADACADPAERADWTLRLGRALRERRDAPAAVAAFRRVLADRPGDREAESALRQLHRENQEPEPLARLLEAQIARTAGAKEVPLRLELASLLEGLLSRPADALLHLRRVLEIEPDNTDALERALRLAEEIGAPDLLVETLGTAIEATRDERTRAELLTRQGELLGGPAQRPEEAAVALREALALDPTHVRARRSLRATLEVLGDWASVLDSLLVESRRASPSERVGLFDEAARIAELHLGPDAALPWLERLRAERPDDAEILARLADTLRQTGRPEALLRALGEQIALVSDPARRRALQLESAHLLETALSAPARAIAVLETVRAEAPDDPRILAALDRLLAVTGRPRERAAILERRIAAIAPKQRAELQREAAALYLGPLNEPDRAAAHLRAVLDVFDRGVEGGRGSRLALLQSYGRALRASGQLDAWARVAEEELAALDPAAQVFAERRAELRRELARAYGRQLARPDEALAHLRALADSEGPDDEDEAALAAAASADQALIEHLRAQGSFAELARRLARRLAERPGEDDAASWLELARLREERLHEPHGAAEAFRAVLERDRGCLEAMRGLRRVAERSGDWPAVADGIEQELELRADAPGAERAALLRRLGQIAWSRLESTTRASRAFAAALEADPKDLASLRAQEELFETMENWRGTADLYEREIALLDPADKEHARALQLRIADLARDRLGDLPRAIAAMEAADALEPLESHRRVALAELYRRVEDLPRYVDTALVWSDQPDSGATRADHLLLCDALQELGRSEDALERAQRAIELDDTKADAWERVGRLREELGDSEGAAAALAACAERSPDGIAAEHLHQAAELVAARDPEQAAAWLRSATALDPTASRAYAALAQVASGLGSNEEAEHAAARALDLAGDGSLDAAAQLATGLLGARAAREVGHLEQAARFAAAACALDPESPDALALEGDALFALGEFAGARRALETRLALADGGAERSPHLALLGAALEAAGELEPALARFEEAAGVKPSLDEAHAGVVRLRERLGRLEAAYEAAVAWAGQAGDPQARTTSLVRAAELELARGGSEATAEGHLRDALAADPANARACLLLTQRLAERDEGDEALALSERALAAGLDADDRARLCLLRARLLEMRGERRAAAEACRLAAEADPHSCAAALGEARLLRSMGEWRAAADALAAFAEQHPGGDSRGLAQVHFQRGRLLAGPLEDLDGSLDAYRRAIAASPGLREAQESLAALLVHRPESWDEALARHRELLAGSPARADSLRAAIHVARGRGDETAVSKGLAILRALGVASPDEREAASERLGMRSAKEPALGNPAWEAARRVAQEASPQLARALGGSPSPGSDEAGEPCAAFRTAALQAEGRLAAAALVPVPTAELAEALGLVAHLAIDARQVRADGRLVNSLSAELGRRARRRVRKALGAIPPAEIAEIDFEAWRAELRDLAHAVALDATGGDLRAALCALLETGPDRERREPGPEADLTALVEGSREASALMARVVECWFETFQHGGALP